MVKKFRMLVLLVASMAVGMIFIIAPSSASAYGQCGPGTSNPNTWVSQLSNMGVLSQTENLMAYAGFHRMDGSFRSWVNQRVIAVHLANAADPVDYGCHYGSLFSVGPRTLPAGTSVLVVLPSQYSKSQISTHPRRGFHRIKVCSDEAGKVACDNPEKGKVCYYLWVPNKRHRSHKAPVYIQKVCVTGDTPFTCPTGTFRFTVSAKGYATRTVTLYHNPQEVAKYKVGTLLTVTELQPLGPDQWQTVSASVQYPRVQRSGNTVVFKDREVTPPPPPPPPECTPPQQMTSTGTCATPPSASVYHVQEVYETTDPNNPITNVFTATVTAPSGDLLQVCFYAGALSSDTVAGSFSPSCQDVTSTATTQVQSTYTSPSEVGTDTYKATVSDLTTGLNNTGQSDGSNLWSFPVQAPPSSPS